MSLPEPCSCTEPGFCPRHQMNKVGRVYAICQGTALTPEKCDRYRWKWDKAVGIESDEPPPVPIAKKRNVDQPRPAVSGVCQHRGEETRTVQCPTCNGSIKLKVFACDKFGECTIGKTLPDLAYCRGCEHFQLRAV